MQKITLRVFGKQECGYTKSTVKMGGLVLAGITNGGLESSMTIFFAGTNDYAHFSKTSLSMPNAATALLTILVCR